MSYKAVSKYVTKFISEHGLDEKWNENDFKKLFREKKSKKLDGIKKNKSAYMFFCINERENLKTENLQLNNKEIVRELAERWKKLKDENPGDVSKYEALAAQDKTRYEQDKSNYVDKEDHDEDGGAKKKKKQSSSDIKKNKSAYMFFCINERENIKTEKLTLSNKEIISEMAQRWAKLKVENPDEVSKYEALAAQDKTRYESEKSSGVKVEQPLKIEIPSLKVEIAEAPPKKEKKKEKKEDVADAPKKEDVVVEPKKEKKKEKKEKTEKKEADVPKKEDVADVPKKKKKEKSKQ